TPPARPSFSHGPERTAVLEALSMSNSMITSRPALQLSRATQHATAAATLDHSLNRAAVHPSQATICTTHVSRSINTVTAPGSSETGTRTRSPSDSLWPNSLSSDLPAHGSTMASHCTFPGAAPLDPVAFQ